MGKLPKFVTLNRKSKEIITSNPLLKVNRKSKESVTSNQLVQKICYFKQEITSICHGIYDDILLVPPGAYLVAQYQMSSGPHGPIFI